MRSAISNLLLTLCLLSSPAWAQTTIGNNSGLSTAGAYSVASGGNGCGVPIPFAQFPANPVINTNCTAKNSSQCTAGVALDGNGTTLCPGVWNGSQWLPAAGATSNGGAGIAGVNAAAPLSSTGGSTPTISAANPYPVANGGTGSTSIPGAGQTLVGNGSVYVPRAISGDCTMSQTGAFTCTKTNGSSFGALATSGSPATVSAGGTGTTAPTQNAVALGEGASSAFNFVTLAYDQLLAGVTGGDPIPKAIPNCQDSAGQHLNYNTTTHVFSCGTTSSTVITANTLGTTGANQQKYATGIGAGGLLSGQPPADADISFSDILTGNAATTQHGFTPKLSGVATQFLNGNGGWTTPVGTNTVPGGAPGSIQVNNNGAFGPLSAFNCPGNQWLNGTGAAGPANANCAQPSDQSLATFSDVLTNNASTGAHGFLPKLDGTAGHFLNGVGAWATPPVTTTLADTAITMTPGSTAGNTSTTAHGFAPVLDNTVTHFLNGQGGWTTPPNGGSPGGAGNQLQINNGGGGFAGYTGTSGRQPHQFMTNLDLNGAATWTQPADSDISFSDILTNNASIQWHGFLPKLNNSTTQFLNGQGAWATPAYPTTLADSAITMTNGITTGDVSTTAHGYAPIRDGVATHFLNGAGGWTAPAGGSASGASGTVQVSNGSGGFSSYGGVSCAPVAGQSTFLTGLSALGAGSNCQQVTDANLSMTASSTTNNVSTSQHGFAPTLDGNSLHFLNGTGGYTTPPGAAPGGAANTLQINNAGSLGAYGGTGSATGDSGGIGGGAARPANEYMIGIDPLGTGLFAQPADKEISFTDITNNNASTSAHGFLPKLDNVASHFLNGTGGYSTPTGTGGTINAPANSEIGNPSYYTSATTIGGVPHVIHAGTGSLVSAFGQVPQFTWTANHGYDNGSLIADSNGNTERNSVAACTTGSGAHPTWSTNIGSAPSSGADNSCNWTLIAFGEFAPSAKSIIIADPGQTYTVSSALLVGIATGVVGQSQSLDQILQIDGANIQCTNTAQNAASGYDCIVIGNKGHLAAVAGRTNGISSVGTSPNGYHGDSVIESMSGYLSSRFSIAYTQPNMDVQGINFGAGGSTTINKANLWISTIEGQGEFRDLTDTSGPAGGTDILVDDASAEWNELLFDNVYLGGSAFKYGIDIECSHSGNGGEALTWVSGAVTDDTGTGTAAVNVNSANGGSCRNITFTGIYFEGARTGHSMTYMFNLNNVVNFTGINLDMNNSASPAVTDGIHIVSGNGFVTGRCNDCAGGNTINNTTSGFTLPGSVAFNYSWASDANTVPVIDTNAGLANGFGPGPKGTYYSAAGNAIATCSASIARTFACVSDANQTCSTAGSTYTTGGANSCLVECNNAGNAWKTTGVSCQ